MSFICHIHNYTEWMCSLHLTHPNAHTRRAFAPGEQLGVRSLAQGSHLSHGHFQPEPGFEPTTSGYKSNALSIRPRLPRAPCLYRGLSPRQTMHFLFIHFSYTFFFTCSVVFSLFYICLLQAFSAFTFISEQPTITLSTPPRLQRSGCA